MEIQVDKVKDTTNYWKYVSKPVTGEHIIQVYLKKEEYPEEPKNIKVVFNGTN